MQYPTPHTPPSPWLSRAVAHFGDAVRAKLAGPGEPEAAIRSPIEELLRTAGSAMGVHAVFHDEVRDPERQVRPDYAITVNGAVSGYIEVKAPGRSIDPATFTGHDKRQWDRQRDLPNLAYTNGTEWRLYRDGELLRGPEIIAGDLRTSGPDLIAHAGLESLLSDLLKWHPASITNVAGLVRAIAPLTRLLRGEVLDQLSIERRAVAAGAPTNMQPFTGLARDWRGLLFPDASDGQFADGYAQTVTFALLLARTSGIDVSDQPLHVVGSALGASHSLMGRALQLLTDDVAAEFKVTLDLLNRVVGAVRWDRIRSGRRDPYLYLYEDFLTEYDPDLRQSSGSYYTPHEVVEPMVRLVEEVLVTRLGKSGFADDDVYTVDPAMGTGAYLQAVLNTVAQAIESDEGPGAVPGRLADVSQRVAGFEIQMGPYAVAQLRAGDLLTSYGASPPESGMHLYVTDTLDDPYAPVQQLASGLSTIAKSRAEASQVKANQAVTVVLGNPPWDENAAGRGGWVERGSAAHGKNAKPIMDDFRIPGDGVYAQNLKNMYVFFWRWATWKVWESTPSREDAGVVCFISTAGYTTGPAFRGMRQYLRRWATEGWVIDLTPEGQTPPVQTRVFPDVRQPLVIGLFVRRRKAPLAEPADIRTLSVHGTQAEKFARLAELSLDEPAWLATRTGWTDRFTPAAQGAWDDWPAMDDLMPWTSPGVTPNRTWPYSPSRQVLQARWAQLVSEGDPDRKRELFKESRDARLDKVRDPLPGDDVYRGQGAFDAEHGDMPAPVRVGFRAFDRQWLIPDARLMHAPRPPLWEARVLGQVFAVELHSAVFKAGPAVVFSAFIPDMHFFKGSEGGRALPFLHADGTANLASNLAVTLSETFSVEVSDQDVLAYISAVAGHPGYRETFAEELRDPGVRIPITGDPALWDRAVRLGRKVLAAHTFGLIDPESVGVPFPVGDPRRIQCMSPVTAKPTQLGYDAGSQLLVVGAGTFGPVTPQVRSYQVGGRNVLDSWFGYRRSDPAGRKSSPLDFVLASAWEPTWTTELIEILSCLTRLVDLEPEQIATLADICDGSVLTVEDLAKAGVKWPRNPAQRRSKRAMGPMLGT